MTKELLTVNELQLLQITLEELAYLAGRAETVIDRRKVDELFRATSTEVDAADAPDQTEKAKRP